jgi:hypothetical protein
MHESPEQCAPGFSFYIEVAALARDFLGEVALPARRCVAMDQAFAGCAIEQLDGATTLIIGGVGGTRLLDGGTKLGALRAVPDSSRTGLPHVLFR